MVDLTRRSFIASAAAIPFWVWLETDALARAQTPLVRYDAWSPQGQKMLKTYAQAVEKMKSTAEGDPRSWVFQWYTHWVAPKDANLDESDPKQKVEELARIYPAPSPWRALAEEMWDTCQAHADPSPPAESFFLPWHRMFVYFFERIIRCVSGDASFTLPYWDYTVADSAIHGVMPPQFRQQGDPTFGSLYVENRNPGVNDGNPIQKGQPVDPLNLTSLVECPYDQQGADPGFCMDLDFTLHGAVHVLVGDDKNMGHVPWAARDPIFWMHHCNIDRLWASWNAAGRMNPSLSQTFVFADENGKRLVGNVADFMDVAKLGYAYDRLENVPECPVPPARILAAAKNQKRVATVKAASIKLGSDPVKVTLEPLPEREGLAPAPFSAQVASLKEGKRFYLVVKDLRAEKQPGVLYHVYLELPSGAAGEKLKAHHVGVLNFFHSAGHGAHGHEKPPQKGAGNFLSFDITDLAKTLHAKKLLSDKPTVTIAPAGQPAADAKPVIGDITLVEQ